MSVYGFHQQLEVEMFCHLPYVHTLSVAVDTHMRLQKLEAQFLQVRHLLFCKEKVKEIVQIDST